MIDFREHKEKLQQFFNSHIIGRPPATFEENLIRLGRVSLRRLAGSGARRMKYAVERFKLHPAVNINVDEFYSLATALHRFVAEYAVDSIDSDACRVADQILDAEEEQGD